MDALKAKFLELLPTKPYCSDEKGAHQIRTKRHAVRRAYIQANPPHLCAWLVFDCDHADLTRFEDAGLPPPNWLAVTPGKGSYHMAYAIDPVYTTERAKPHPLRYLAAIQRTYTQLLNADPAYTGLITKNPLHPTWATWWLHGHVYSLGELADYVTLAPASRSPKPEESTGYGRNVDLFNLTRRWAYRAVVDFDQHTAFAAAVQEQAEGYNGQFAAPLPLAEVKSVAKSVAKFTWRKRADFIRRHRERIGLNPDLPLETKQALGAAYTASVKSEATQGKIRAARQMLIAQGKKASQSAVQAVTGLGIATIKRHWATTNPEG